MAKALPFIHQPDGVAQRASDVSAADWRYQTGVKKISYFSISVFAAFLRARNPCRTHKYFIYSCFKKSCGKKSVKKHAEISLVLFSFTSGFQRNLRKVIVGTRHRRLNEVIYLNC